MRIVNFDVYHFFKVGEGGRFVKKMARFFLFKLVEMLLILQNLMVLDGGWWSRTIRRPTLETSDAIASNKCSTLLDILLKHHHLRRKS